MKTNCFFCTQTLSKYSNMPQNIRVTTGLENYSFTKRNTITEDKLTNTFASGNKMTGDADKETHGAPVPLRREAVGGPQQASHAAPKRQDQGYSATPWLLKPQIYEAATELGYRK